MSGTITSPTAAYVDATGIHAPTYQDIVTYLVSAYQNIYGNDIVVDPATQDGQLIGIFALAIADANNACIAAYNSFSPSTAQGVGLSSEVKLNGITRAIPTNGTVNLLITGIAGTEIINGVAQDGAGTNWVLPALATIPFEGEVLVLASASPPGSVPALPNTITRIATPTYGWQAVTNPTAAVMGAPVESDGELRARQSASTMLPSSAILDGITGGLASLVGVTDYRGYENDTNTDYTNVPVPPIGIGPLPPHSISLVVLGGDPTAICQTILNKKTPGCYTYGTTRETVSDVYGFPHGIGFFIPAPVPISVGVTLKPLPGYTNAIGAMIANTVAAYINGLRIGDDVIHSKLWLPANLCDATGAPSGATGTYDIIVLTVGALPGIPLGYQNILIAFNARATCDAKTNVTITVQS